MRIFVGASSKSLLAVKGRTNFMGWLGCQWPSDHTMTCVEILLISFRMILLENISNIFRVPGDELPPD